MVPAPFMPLALRCLPQERVEELEARLQEEHRNAMEPRRSSFWGLQPTLASELEQRLPVKAGGTAAMPGAEGGAPQEAGLALQLLRKDMAELRKNHSLEQAAWQSRLEAAEAAREAAQRSLAAASAIRPLNCSEDPKQEDPLARMLSELRARLEAKVQHVDLLQAELDLAEQKLAWYRSHATQHPSHGAADGNLQARPATSRSVMPTTAAASEAVQTAPLVRGTSGTKPAAPDLPTTQEDHSQTAARHARLTMELEVALARAQANEEVAARLQAALRAEQVRFEAYQRETRLLYRRHNKDAPTGQAALAATPLAMLQRSDAVAQALPATKADLGALLRRQHEVRATQLGDLSSLIERRMKGLTAFQAALA